LKTMIFYTCHKLNAPTYQRQFGIANGTACGKKHRGGNYRGIQPK